MTKTYEIYAPKDRAQPTAGSTRVAVAASLRDAKIRAEDEACALPADVRHTVVVYGAGRKYWVDSRTQKWTSVLN